MPLRTFILFVLLHTSVTVIASPCNICKGGEDITLPEASIRIPGFEFLETCADLNNTIPFALQQGSEDCDGVQSIGSICGCPIAQEDACYLCPDGSLIQQPDREIPLFESLFPAGIIPTCNLFQAYLLSSTNTSDPLCITAQNFLGSYCGCSGSIPVVDDKPTCSLCPGASISMPEKVINLFEFETCRDFADAIDILVPQGTEQCEQIQSIAGLCGCENLPKEPCTMCRDGSSTTELDRIIPFVESPFGDTFSMTCELYDSYLLSLDKDDQRCELSQGIGSYCGCPPVENHCEFCPGAPIEDEFLQKELIFLSEVREAGVIPTCEFVETLLLQVPEDNTIQCFGLQQKNFLCGCNDGEWFYAGAKNIPQKAALSWVQRISGTLSVVGAIAVLSDILPNREKRQRVYCQLVGGMAVCDLISAIPWIIGPLAVPEFIDGEPTGVYGAKGNETTCTVQGFFVELGLGTFMYNVSLAIYYWLVIVRNWRESRLRKIAKWLHAVPITLMLALAFGGIPIFTWLPYVCNIQFFPIEDQLRDLLVFVVVPISTAIIVLTIILISIYFAVRAKSRKVQRYLYGDKMTLEKRVFWQALSYLLAFYVTWPPILSGALVGSVKGNVAYWHSLFILLTAPLQGFLNALVYYRHRVGVYVKTNLKLLRSSLQSKMSNELDGALKDPSGAKQAPLIIIDPSLYVTNEGTETQQELGTGTNAPDLDHSNNSVNASDSDHAAAPLFEIPMPDISRDESSTGSVSVLIPTLSRHNSAGAVPMTTLNRIISEDPSIAIALDDTEFQEIVVPYMPGFQRGVSLDSANATGAAVRKERPSKQSERNKLDLIDDDDDASLEGGISFQGFGLSKRLPTPWEQSGECSFGQSKSGSEGTDNCYVDGIKVSKKEEHGNATD